MKVMALGVDDRSRQHGKNEGGREGDHQPGQGAAERYAPLAGSGRPGRAPGAPTSQWSPHGRLLPVLSFKSHQSTGAGCPNYGMLLAILPFQVGQTQIGISFERLAAVGRGSCAS